MKYAFKCGNTKGLPMGPLSLQRFAINAIAKCNLHYNDKIPRTTLDESTWPKCTPWSVVPKKLYL